MRSLGAMLLVAACMLPCGAAWGAEMPPAARPVPAKIEMADGPFKPTWESLRQYKCPEWFRDAKLGIWGILGPQSLPEFGDWYARHMYIEGNPQYKFHLEHFGHPSKFGYKDLAAAWKAEKFDPDRLMALYKQAGAKYFVVLANHHDNWDNWDSKYHRWNSVNWGPHQDIVGLWAQAARKQGLRFGVTEHLARSYSWFNTNKGRDKQGPLAGVPYDGNDPAYADLYFPPHEDTSSSYPKDPPEWWPRQWYWRMRDLLDTYKPDLMYSDGAIPFGEVGRSLFAHYYNANMSWHDGKLEAVYNIKNWGKGAGHGDYEDVGVEDVERGALQEIKAQPWQTDTCIGDWFYKTGLRYKPAKQVIAMLADIVSKNGNLLLNIPLKHDGTIDADEEKVLADMAGWIAINGEAIYGTRPWQVFGEGAGRLKSGHFNEGSYGRMSARDIRFTTRGDALYAIALGWPDNGKLVVRSLALPAGKVSAVSLLGHAGKLDWSQTDGGLDVNMPAQKLSDIAVALKITGENLKPVPVVADLIGPGPDGRFVLRAADAIIHGDTPQYESGDGKDQIGYWANAGDWVSWDITLAKPGTFKVSITYSCDQGAGGSEFTVEAGSQKLAGKSKPTGSWATYTTEELGSFTLEQPGKVSVSVRPKADPKWKVIGLKSVVLTPG
ncbi:MAG: alpha-L-fucosidase [Tepidisphaerales bacterium]